MILKTERKAGAAISLVQHPNGEHSFCLNSPPNSQPSESGRSLRACGAGSRLRDPGWAIALVYSRRSNPPLHTQDPRGSRLLGLFVCMQDGEGLQHCLHKIQSLTISKTALAQHQQNSVQSPHAREHTHPTFPASQARNFSATEGCHCLVTMATQPTLNQTKKKK